MFQIYIYIWSKEAGNSLSCEKIKQLACCSERSYIRRKVLLKLESGKPCEKIKQLACCSERSYIRRKVLLKLESRKSCRVSLSTKAPGGLFPLWQISDTVGKNKKSRDSETEYCWFLTRSYISTKESATAQCATEEGFRCFTNRRQNS